jgi:hypothetical protein
VIPPAKPPPIPQRALRPTPPPPLPGLPAARHGELAHRERPKSDLIAAIPTMIVNQGSSPVVVPPLPTGVLDLSGSVPADTWMADPDTDLLGAHRRKTLRSMLIAIAAIVALGVGLFVFLQVYQPADRRRQVAPPPPDAAAVEAPADAPARPVDADERDRITALSRYGFLSLAATAKTAIYIDGKLIGDAPLTRLPLGPGVYKLKAVGPRGKVKNLKVTIYGGQDTDEGTIQW